MPRSGSRSVHRTDATSAISCGEPCRRRSTDQYSVGRRLICRTSSLAPVRRMLPSVAQLMTRSKLAVRHTVPEATDHDWKVTDRCEQCREPIFTLRRGPDFGRQAEHKLDCGKQ